MFNNQDNEADFCDSYKSQILGHGKQTEEVSFFSIFLKLLTIFMLLVAIVGFMFYGYKYFMSNKTINDVTSLPSSIQVSDEELVVKMQETQVDAKKEIVEKISPPVSQQVKELEMKKMANDVKILIANSETKEENEAKETLSQDRQEIEKLEVPSSSAPEAQYLEELADLSKEIDKERSQ